MEKKGAIGLSVKMLVVVIISLALFGAGITFLYKLVGGAEETKALLDARTEAQLESLLVDEGKRVALPRHSIAVFPGDFKSLGIGVLNIDAATFGKSFTLGVSLSKAVDRQEKVLKVSKTVVGKWLLFHKGPYTIEENGHQKMPIGVNVPKNAKKGTYIFNAKVIVDKTGKVYDTVKKFTVVVK